MTTYAYRRNFPAEDLPDGVEAANQRIGATLNRLTGLPTDRFNWVSSLAEGDNSYRTTWYLSDRVPDHREAIDRMTAAGEPEAWTESDTAVCFTDGCTVPSLWQRVFMPPYGPLANPRQINSDTDAQEELLDMLRDKGTPIPYRIHRCRIIDQNARTGEITLTWTSD